MILILYYSLYREHQLLSEKSNELVYLLLAYHLKILDYDYSKIESEAKVTTADHITWRAVFNNIKLHQNMYLFLHLLSYLL